MFITRHAEQVLERAVRTFPAVMLTGPRQVGKTTLLRELLPQANYISFDSLDALASAQDNPERFSDSLATPIIIDEIQYAPELLHYLKMAIDARRSEKGRYFLTGSQRFLMMQGVDESLAGRLGTLELLGLSLREIRGDACRHPFIPSDEYFIGRAKEGRDGQGTVATWEAIFRGDLPELYADPLIEPTLYYDSYIDTYLRRDVRDLAHVGDLTAFNRFMAFTAMAHAQSLNKNDLAMRTGISVPTVSRWLSVLEASGIVYLLKPFYANANKRLIKTPKLYFLNSGLAARLCRFASPDALMNSREAGAFFEGFVLTEVIKNHLNAHGRFPELFYYRDSNRNEIDIVLQDGTNLYPIEVKGAQMARESDSAKFKHLHGINGFACRTGAVVYDGTDILPLARDAWACPLWAL
jgi:predicted AAA+ superfamily ATPase